MNAENKFAPKSVSADAATAQIAADVAMMCARVIRTAMYRAGMAPSSATWRVVRYIATSGPVCITDVARRERSTMATVSTLVNRLENQGLIAKSKDPSDARQVLLTVTEKGIQQCGQWEADLGEASSEAYAALTSEEIQTLQKALPVMRKLVQED